MELEGAREITGQLGDNASIGHAASPTPACTHSVIGVSLCPRVVPALSGWLIVIQGVIASMSWLL